MDDTKIQIFGAMSVLWYFSALLTYILIQDACYKTSSRGNRRSYINLKEPFILLTISTAILLILASDKTHDFNTAMTSSLIMFAVFGYDIYTRFRRNINNYVKKRISVKEYYFLSFLMYFNFSLFIGLVIVFFYYLYNKG